MPELRVSAKLGIIRYGKYPLISSNKHKQTLAAITPYKKDYVDEEIKDLIEILNTFEGVKTFESCQDFNNQAFVCMEYDYNILTFASELASSLSKQTQDSDYPDIISPEYKLNISVNWEGNKTKPFLEIQFPNADTEYITSLFRQVRNQFAAYKYDTHK